MLNETLTLIKNFFETERFVGEFKLEGDTIVPLSSVPGFEIKDGQYFRVVGSVFNDGVYKYRLRTFTSEEFSGAIWPLAIPTEVLSLVDEISAYNANLGATSPYTSESFGGYSYSKATGDNGCAVSWEQAFASRLNKWRKL